MPKLAVLVEAARVHQLALPDGHVRATFAHIHLSPRKNVRRLNNPDADTIRRLEESGLGMAQRGAQSAANARIKESGEPELAARGDAFQVREVSSLEQMVECLG